MCPDLFLNKLLLSGRFQNSGSSSRAGKQAFSFTITASRLTTLLKLTVRAMKMGKMILKMLFMMAMLFMMMMMRRRRRIYSFTKNRLTHATI